MRAAILVFVLAIMAACGKSRDRPAPAPATAADRIQLPKSPAGGIHATRKLDADAIGKLAATEHADFDRQVRSQSATSLEVRYTTKTRPTLGVTIEIGPCTGAADCPEMRIEAWRPRQAELRAAALPAALRDRADSRFELSSRVDTVFGEPKGTSTIYTYALGAAFGTGDNGQPAGSYVDSYVLYYNDGVNHFRTTAAYLDDAVGGVDRLLAVAPPQDLEKLATAFTSFYVHACL